jgi:dihydrofolate synthase/folylpolyglutamate synthase
MEKAGIAKAGVPFVIGETDPQLVRRMRESALERGAQVHVLPACYSYSGPMTLVGTFQRRNAAVAEKVLNLLPPGLRPNPTDLNAGIASTFVPGRFDRRGKWLFDVAHNTSGVHALVELICQSDLPGPIHALVAMVGDKDWKAIIPMLRDAVDSMWLTIAPSMPRERVPDLARLASFAGPGVFPEPDFQVALQRVQSDAGTALVTGSFFTVGDALARLPGFAPLG